MTAEHDASGWDAAFEAAVERCRLLRAEDARQFVDKGYVVVKAAFSQEFAATVRESAWRQLHDEHGVRRAERGTWRTPPGRRHTSLPRGYFRTAGGDRRLALRAEAPRAFGALTDLIGGAPRLPPGSELSWGTNAIANLGGDDEWLPPAARQPGWHKDGWHFRHFLDSPEQGLLVVPIYSDIEPRSGGTFIATDSIAPVARLLAAHPQGCHADSVQGAGYLVPHLIEQCGRFEELIGEAGDLAVLHPFLLHRVSANPSPRPRFIANAALVLREPMRFAREDGAYSLAELAVLRALGGSALDYAPTRERLAVVPGPFRDDKQRAEQRTLLEAEMRAMAQAGIASPSWAEEQGYQSLASVQ